MMINRFKMKRTMVATSSMSVSSSGARELISSSSSSSLVSTTSLDLAFLRLTRASLKDNEFQIEPGFKEERTRLTSRLSAASSRTARILSWAA